MHKRLHRATAAITLSLVLLGPSNLMSAALAVSKNVATHNMQGATYTPPGSGAAESKWTTSVLSLMRGQVGGRSGEIEGPMDILALQEAGAVPPTALDNLLLQTGVVTINGLPNIASLYEWNPGTATRPETYYITHWNAIQAGAGNDRTSLAIVTSFNPENIVLSHAPNMTRPIIGVRHGNVIYFCAHAVSGVPAANSDAGLIHQTAAQATSQLETDNGVPPGTFSFVILADWNQSPANLGQVNPPLPATAIVAQPLANTQPSINPTSLLDYMVYSNPPTAPQQFTPATNGFGQLFALVIAWLLSDHLPVKYRINQL
jgi:hypothetical protein